MKLKLKDPWSAITHGIAVLLACAGAAPLLINVNFLIFSHSKSHYSL